MGEVTRPALHLRERPHSQAIHNNTSTPCTASIRDKRRLSFRGIQKTKDIASSRATRTVRDFKRNRRRAACTGHVGKLSSLITDIRRKCPSEIASNPQTFEAASCASSVYASSTGNATHSSNFRDHNTANPTRHATVNFHISRYTQPQYRA